MKPETWWKISAAMLLAEFILAAMLFLTFVYWGLAGSGLTNLIGILLLLPALIGLVQFFRRKQSGFYISITAQAMLFVFFVIGLYVSLTFRV